MLRFPHKFWWGFGVLCGCKKHLFSEDLYQSAFDLRTCAEKLYIEYIDYIEWCSQ